MTGGSIPIVNGQACLGRRAHLLLLVVTTLNGAARTGRLSVGDPDRFEAKVTVDFRRLRLTEA